MSELDQAIEALTKLRIKAVKHGDDKQEKALYDIEQMIFKAYDKLQSEAPSAVNPSQKLDDVKKHYSRLIKLGLKKNNIGQKDLAVMCKAQGSQVSRWTSGNHNFTIDTLHKIQQALKIHLIP